MTSQYVGIRICVAALLMVSPAWAGTQVSNVASGKHVTSGNSGTAEYRRAANRLTDGDRATDAYPGSFSLDYTVDLLVYAAQEQAVEAASYDVRTVGICWGKFGRHFPGVKQPDGSWVPAAYEADYVNEYRVEYLTRKSEEWMLLHEYKGLPTDEKGQDVVVARNPASASSSEGDVVTMLDDLQLRDVVAIRLRASGAHWIGVYELVVLGAPSRSGR